MSYSRNALLVIVGCACSCAALDVGAHFCVRRALSPPPVARLVLQERRPMSWEEELGALLSPWTPAEDRGILARDLLARGAEIAGDVAGALSSGRPDMEQLRKDLGSVQRQIEEDLLPQLPRLFEDDGPQAMQEAAAAAAAGVSQASEATPAALTALLADPSRAVELARQGLAASVQRTPLAESPRYTTVAVRNGYEVREYEPYAIAACDMDAVEGDDLASQIATGSSAFMALAAFMFGSNGREELLGITTPIRIQVAAAAPGGAARASPPSTMAVALPLAYSVTTAPAPTRREVRLEQVPRQTLAVAQFGGFATVGEVARQREALLRCLAADGVSLAGGGRYAVLQYNPPYTLPWQRRNEIAAEVVLAPERSYRSDEDEKCESAPTVARVEEVIPPADASRGDDQSPSDIDV